MKKTLKEILQLAVWAPSGDNLQPWTFKLGDDCIEIFDVSEETLYDFHKHGSYIAHGALIENIIRLSAAKGFTAKVLLFPSAYNQNHIANVTLSKGYQGPEYSVKAIRERFTDRTAYSTRPINPKTLKLLSDSVSPFEVKFELVKNPQKKQKLIDLLTVGDEMILDNKELHSLFYKNVRWTDKELYESKNGMHVRSITPDTFGVLSLKLIRTWTMTKILRLLGLAKITYLIRRAIYKQTSAIGYLAIQKESPQAYIETGRALQALWLTATENGISVQPLSSILFLYSRLQQHHMERLGKFEANLVTRISTDIYKLLQIKNGIITFCVRLGYAKTTKRPPSVRKSPVIKR